MTVDKEQLSLFELSPRVVKRSIAPIDQPIWTESKARLIQSYLRLFTFITKHGTYIDGFAGPQAFEAKNSWAAELVLQNEPRWIRHFHLIDRSRRQVRELENLKKAQMIVGQDGSVIERDINIYQGDFNVVIQQILKGGTIGPNEATFCLLDQRTFECEWDSIRLLSVYKPFKIELFYFLGNMWLDRAIAASRKARRLARWWGRADWAVLRGMTSVNRAQLLAGRFSDELGYRHVSQWPVYERRGNRGHIMYFMIHASDHGEAPQLMRRAYAQATGILDRAWQPALDFG